MKRFLNLLKEKLTAYEIFILLVSAIVGAMFGGLNDYIPDDYKWWVYGAYFIVVVLFLLGAILIQWFSDRFNIYTMIRKNTRRGNYRNAIMLGDGISQSLWHSYQLNLRVKIGEMLINAANKMQNETEIFGGKSYDKTLFIASKYIDDLGYTKYMLSKEKEAYENIRQGIKMLNSDIGKYNKSNHNLDEPYGIGQYIKYINCMSLRLKGYRHLMGMLGDIKRFAQADIQEIETNFEKYYNMVGTELDRLTNQKSKLSVANKKLDDAFDKLQESFMCAKYAKIKNLFHKLTTDNKRLEFFDDEYKKIKNSLDELRKSFEGKDVGDEWSFKCNRLQWEIELFTGDNLNGNYCNLFDEVKLHDKKGTTINRFIDVYKRFLLYAIARAKYIVSEDVNSINELKEINKNVCSAHKEAKIVLLRCEAKQRIEQLNLIYKQFKRVYKWKTHCITKCLVLQQFDLILVDFDYTIFNYRKAERFALRKTIKLLRKTCKINKSMKEIYVFYRELNKEEWSRLSEYDGTEVEKREAIRHERADRLRQFLGIEYESRTADILKSMDRNIVCNKLFNGAKKYLRKTADYCVVITEAKKDRAQKILKNIIASERVFSSTDCGFSKKDNGYLLSAIKEYAMPLYYKNNTEKNYAKRILVIGDNENTDIAAVKRFGCDMSGCLIVDGEACRENVKPNYSKCSVTCDGNIYHVKDFKALTKLKKIV